MKRVITYTILLLSIILTTATAHSQSYPVQANLYVMAPYSQTYSDYYADGQQRMFVNILLNDMSQGQLDVVLRFTISGNGLKLTSKPAATVKPITILSGKLCRIEGSELAQYLKPEQMQVEGRKADEFNKSGRLPEGYYEIKVEVVEFYRKVRISAPVYTTMWIMQPEAPVWTMPQKGVRLDATNPQFVMFGWMLTNSTSLLQNVKYTFSIYAKPDDINPDVVARTTTPLYSETLTQTMLVYGPDKPLLELGGTYVCRIKAEDADGNVTFKNDGYSETLVFRYGQTCDPPKQVTITDVTKKGATVNWVESGNYSGYDIEVRETTGGKSSDWYVWNIDKQVHSYDLKQLAVSSSYECRVAAVCGQRSNGIRSQYSDVVSFKTYDAGNKNYTCGDLVEANKHEDRVPYPYLEEGDVIEANGFLFAIESISKASEGVFSGQCSWYIDLWGVSILCDFKDISINRHQQLIAGKIEACRDKVKAKAFTRLQSAAYMPIGTQVPSTFTAEKVIKMEETVDSIRIVNGQTLIYVAGKEPQKVDATDDVFVQSPDGNYYAVEGGNVYPKPSNLDSEGNRQLSYTQQLVATFGYDDAMGSHPGVDSYTDAKAPFAAQYTQYQLHSNDAYATWMAVEKYRTSMAKVTVSGGDRDSIQLRSNGQLMVRTNATEPNALYMPISTEGLYEAYYTTKDNKEKDVEVVAGQLNVAAYERNTINVCLVGVNGEHYQYNVSELSNYLNKVFGQAVTSVNLTTASIDVDKFNGTLSAKESGALSAYNSDMKKLIRKVKKLPDYNSETYYIMLVERSDDQTLGGFMPVNSNFGFVFAKANSGKEQLNRTIAHELAHGAFRLWHTFSSENIYVAQQGSTQNLMDYNGTNSELYKYQWDYIHNPQQGIVRWMVDDEEGKYYEATTTDIWNRNINNIACANYNNQTQVEFDGIWPVLKGSFSLGNIGEIRFEIPETAAAPNDKLIDLSSQKTDYTDDSKFLRVVYKSVSKKYRVYFDVPVEKATDFLKIINSPESYYETLISNIPEEESQDAYSKLIQLPVCSYERIGISNRIKYLEWLSSELWTNTDQERIILDLITHVSDRKELYDELYKRPVLVAELMMSCDGENRQKFIDEITKLCDENWGSNVQAKGDVYIGTVPSSYGSFYSGSFFITYAVINETNSNCNVLNYIGRFPHGLFDWGNIQELKHLNEFSCNPLDPVYIYSSDGAEGLFPLIYPVNLSEQLGTEQVIQQFAATLNYIGIISSVRILVTGSKFARSFAFVDLTKTGLDLIFEDAQVIQALNSTEEGKQFLKYWNIVSVTIDVTTISADVLEGIIKHGPEASKVLRSAGKNDAAKNVDDLVAESKKIKVGTNSKIIDELDDLLTNSNLSREINGNTIKILDKGEELFRIEGDKFIVNPQKWGAHYKGDVEKKLDNGYWLVKNKDGSYSIDLGFKEGRKLTGKEVNEYYMGIGKLPPYTDGCVITEEVLKPGKEFYMVIDGIVEDGGTKVVNYRPGGWATNDAITTIKELREDMAVLESWKKLEFEPTRVKFRVTKELPVRNGVVGPQVDFPIDKMTYADETIYFNPVLYKGGNQQYEIVLPKEINWRGEDWKKYLKEIERLELK
ncbi:MAG: fibronectin type III domain-containing protein [Salinivirgaceae bacterium]|nr:fibronectin type III domain-containing protein [Salinivirgaceae bacterium]